MKLYSDEYYDAMAEANLPIYTAEEMAELFMLRQQIYPEGKDLQLLAILGRTQDKNNRTAVTNWVVTQMVYDKLPISRRDYLDVLVNSFGEIVLDLTE